MASQQPTPKQTAIGLLTQLYLANTAAIDRHDEKECELRGSERHEKDGECLYAVEDALHAAILNAKAETLPDVVSQLAQIQIELENLVGFHYDEKEAGRRSRLLLSALASCTIAAAECAGIKIADVAMESMQELAFRRCPPAIEMVAAQ